MARICFFYDFVSPVCYLAAREMRGFGRGHGVVVEWLPVVSSELIQAAVRGPAAAPRPRCHRFRYHAKRWADLLGVPFKMAYPAAFDPQVALRAVQGVEEGDRIALTVAIFGALWRGTIRPDRHDWVAEVCRQAGLPETWATPDDPAAATAQLRRNTEDACDAGIFTVPAFLLDTGRRRRPFRGLEQLELLRWTLERGEEGGRLAGHAAPQVGAGACDGEPEVGPARSSGATGGLSAASPAQSPLHGQGHRRWRTGGGVADLVAGWPRW